MRNVTIFGLLLILFTPAAGCSRPAMPSLVGQNMFHDLTEIRKGMSPNEVQRVMGSHYKTIFEEGILGVDGGNFIWEYPEGRVHFNMDGVTRVVPN